MQTDQDGELDYEQALKFLYDRINYERLVTGASRYPFRLQRIAELLSRLELTYFLHDAKSPARPPKPLVHIAGTKGKGSTATMVAAVLTAAGYRTGLFTSPHLYRLEERFRIDGKPCSQSELTSLVQRIKPAALAMAESHGAPSFFELTTAMALLHFDTCDCDVNVLEVGLGGRLDSTNVCAPTVCAVTSIGLDHQHVLGDTLVEIAAEKAGIIKTDAPVVSGVADQAAADVVAQQAAKWNAPLRQLGMDFQFESLADRNWGSSLVYRGGKHTSFPSEVATSIALEGSHQARNAAMAIAILDALQQQQSVNIPVEAIQNGLGSLQCMGRIERFDLPGEVLGIIDSAHNEDSIQALCECLRARSRSPVVVVFGTSIDKAAKPMLNLLSNVADELVLTQFVGNPRFQTTTQLQASVSDSMSTVTVVENPVQACQSALDSLKRSPSGGTLVVCGSFFLAAETRDWMKELSSSGSDSETASQS